MGKFQQILTELFAQDMLIFSFLDDNLSKCQKILTGLGTCIDIKEIWFWIANELSAHDMIMVGYYHFTVSFQLKSKDIFSYFTIKKVLIFFLISP